MNVKLVSNIRYQDLMCSQDPNKVKPYLYLSVAAEAVSATLVREIKEDQS